jgi:Fur family transcriptional regulator, ferric uptake regulator
LVSVDKMRMTNQRRVILNELIKTKSHPSADELYIIVRNTIPNISLGTIYRNLEILSQTGEILKLDYGNGQMRYDGDIKKHYHIHCQKCNRIDDLEEDVMKNPEFCPEKMKNYIIIEFNLYFRGICKNCQVKTDK